MNTVGFEDVVRLIAMTIQELLLPVESGPALTGRTLAGLGQAEQSAGKGGAGQRAGRDFLCSAVFSAFCCCKGATAALKR